MVFHVGKYTSSSHGSYGLPLRWRRIPGRAPSASLGDCAGETKNSLGAARRGNLGKPCERRVVFPWIFCFDLTPQKVAFFRKGNFPYIIYISREIQVGEISWLEKNGWYLTNKKS